MILYEQDGVASGGIDNLIPDATPETTTTTTTTDSGTQTEQTPDPTWFSQMPKEIRDTYREDLKGYKNIADLADAYVKGKKDLEKAIKIPTKESSEEDVKKFFNSLGMPESADEYDFPDMDYKDLGLDDEAIGKLRNLFKDAAWGNALTKKQAHNLWLKEMAMTKVMKGYRDAEQKRIEESFEPSYNKLLEAEYPVEAERHKAIKGEMERVKTFLTETGLAKLFKEKNIIYDSEAMHEISQYVKKHTGSFVEGNGEESRKSVGAMGNYSEAFLKAAGK